MSLTVYYKYCHCPDHSKVQISSILSTKEKTFKLQYNNVQMQSGEADCGLFAITFATALSNGLHPGAYIFDQSMMRSHLLHCFENGKIDNFSVRRKRRVNNKIKRVEEFNVYCTCRRPITPGSEFIQCGVCREWFHSNTCVQVEKVFKNTKMKWLCSFCKS